MFDMKITRRGFAVGSAAAAGAALAGGLAASRGVQAFAEGEEPAAESAVLHSVSGATAARPAFAAYVVDGVVDHVVADAADPRCGGFLAEADFSALVDEAAWERVESPLRRTGEQAFETISWEEAYGAAAEALSGAAGPVTVLAGSSPVARLAARRLADALPSASYADTGAASSASLRGGTAQAVGYEGFVADVARTRAALLLGGTYESEGLGFSAQVAEAVAGGARIVAAGPRFDGVALVASEWLPLRPGTELALVLAVSRQLWTLGAFDSASVSSQAEGLGEWAASLEGCSLSWGARVCGVAEADIESLAASLAAAAPAAVVALPQRVGDGVAAPSGELARAVALLNTLLGCWNVPGGAYLEPASPFAEADGALAEGAKGSYDLAPEGGSAVALLEGLAQGASGAVVAVGVDGLAALPGSDAIAEALAGSEASVAISDVLTPLASQCAIVLPAADFLANDDVPEVITAPIPAVARAVALRAPVGEARPTARIVSELGEACGCPCPVDVEEAAAARAAAVSLDCADLARAGVVGVPALAVAADAPWPTASGKVQFASKACDGAGVGSCPCWEDLPALGESSLVLLTDAEGASASPASAALDARYGRPAVWVSSADAEARGIAEGDDVVVENELARCTAPAKVTDRVVAGAVYVPSSVVTESGFGPAAFAPLAGEAGYGGSSARQVIVTVGKAGA